MKHRIVSLLVIVMISGSAFVLSGCQFAYQQERIARLPQPELPKIVPLQKVGPVQALYRECHLAGKLRFDIFRNAMYGYQRIDFPKKGIITIIDFTRPSSAKRLFVIDLVHKQILYHTYVAHGVNSGILYAVNFSNKMNSKESSLGFFETAETYTGKYGRSLRLDGLEPGINDMARKRDIVMHGAEYVGKNIAQEYGCVGRSWGCPALSESVVENVINVIQGGSCLYIYADNKNYIEHSRYVVSRKINRWRTDISTND